MLDGVISGTGKLAKDGAGTLALTAANTYSGGTALHAGRLDVGSHAALGTGALAMDEGTTLGFTVGGLNLANAVVLTGIADPIIDTGSFTETLSGAISGGGALTKNGSGTLVLSGANSYAGATTVAAGTLRAGAANAFSASSAQTVAAGATLETAGLAQTVAALNNSGTVSLLGNASGSTLTVNGAYVGNGGVLKLGTALGNSGSVSDRLVLNGPGASASGKTSVQVTNLGGLGALTTANGINLITAQNGATTTAQTTKDAFTLANGHVDAGAFEYRLYAADANGAGENWYLRSTSTLPTIPTTSNNAVAPAAVAPATAAAPLPTYRAEVPLYAALPSVLRQGDVTMLSNLHRRMGDETASLAPAGDGGSASRRGWARVIDGTSTIEQSGVTAPESNSSMQGLQAGVDLFANGNWNAGLYAGQLRSDARVDGFYGLSFFSRGYAGQLRADTTYLGGYATYANPQGQYADFVLQYGHHDVTGTPVLGISYDSSGHSVTASAEAGQRFALGNGWGIEPQAQLIVNQQSLGRTLIAGALVAQDPATAVIGRLGVRIGGDFTTGMGRLLPYARLNVWHGFSGTDTTSFVGPAAATPIAQGIGYTSTEAALGFTLDLTPSTSLYGEVGKLFHSGGSATAVSASVQGSLGLKVKF
jgi:autotransporter-associated beta strand protein